MTPYLAALFIQAFAFAVHLYRARMRQGLSPDGVHYLAMAQGIGAPDPLARRWLLPALLGTRAHAWTAVSGIAWLASGPLLYASTGALWTVWMLAWLPGLALNVRFPVLTDQTAIALMLGAAALERYGYTPGACVLLVLAAQVKETAGLFGAVLCWSTAPWATAAGVLGTALALRRGRMRGTEADEEYLLHPFRVALTKHDPLDWKTMLLPWGGVLLVGVGAWQGMGRAEVIAALSLAMGYGQLLIANDEARLFAWAAPAVLVAVAGYDGPLLVPALVLHPFLCGACRRA